MRHRPAASTAILLFALICLSCITFAQTNLPANTIVTQTFNSMNTGLSLPANWRVSASGAGATATWAAGAGVVTQAANNGAPATGGSYNWGTTAGTDRAVGFLTSGVYASPNAVMGYYRNTTGATITTLTISYAVERYKINNSAASINFFSSIDGNSWTARTTGDISTGVFTSAASSYTFGSPQSVYRTVTISGLSIANNGDFYFRWVFTDATPATAQGLGLDNVAVFAGTATPAVMATLRDLWTIDNAPLGQINPGDQLTYMTVIKNNGTGDANNVVLTEPAPANTTLVGGSVKTSALANNDNYTTNINTVLNVAAAGVLVNDYGIPSPTVLSFGPTANAAATVAGTAGVSDNGGSVTVNSDGSFSYTPPSASFTGIDKFAYTATTGNAPDNEAIVTITVGAAALASNDSYNIIGNVAVSPAAGAGVLSNDAGNSFVLVSVNGGASNVGVAILTSQGGNLTVNADGSFNYNPPAGFEGTDNFTYSIDNGFANPSTATVTLNVSGMVWFINNAGGAGDGRLTSPFNSITAFQSINNNSGNNPAVNDNIFIYESATAYTGGLTLLTGQKLTGQDATATLSTITGLVPNAVYSLPFPIMNATAGQTATLTTVAVSTNAITLGSGNTVRGLTIAATTGAKISGNNFGTATIGDNASPDVTLSGAGQALNLTTGTFGATTGFASIASTSSTTQGIVLSGITGAANFGSTSISGSTTQGILIGTTTANINFGNTTVTGGTDGVSLQNNSAGTRTFGTLSITSTGGNTSFLHAVDGGTTVIGATTISNATGTAIDIQNATTAVSFGATAVTKSGAGTAININATNGNITFTNVILGTSLTRLTGPAVVINGGTGIYDFGSASIFTNGVTAFSATNADGTINTSGGTIDATGGSAIVINGPAGITTLGITLTTINANGGTNNVSFVNCGGSTTLNAGTLTGTAAGAVFNVSGGTVNITYNGSITQAANAAIVNISGGHNGITTFQTGTLSATNGTGLQFDNADGTYNFLGLVTLNGGDAGIDIINGSNGIFSFSSNTSIVNPSGTMININTSSAGNFTYSGTFSKTSAGIGIQVNAKTGGTVTFNGTGTKVLSTSTSTAVNLTSNTGGTINFSGNNLLLTTTSGIGFNATGGGTISVAGTGNTITSTTGTALNVNATTIGVTGMTFLSISAGTTAAGPVKGISLNNTGSGGFTITGTGTTNGSGGIIQDAAAGSTMQRGIELINAQNISLSNITMTNACRVQGAVSDGTFGGTENTDENGAIHLQSVINVNLNNVDIAGSVQHGINGNAVTNFDYTNGIIDNTGNAVWESGIYIFNLRGTSAASNDNTITNSTIQNTGQFNVFIQNNGSTNAAGSPANYTSVNRTAMDAVTISNVIFLNSGVNVIGDHVSVFNNNNGANLANFRTVVTNCTFTSHVGTGVGADYAGAHTSDGIQVDASGTAHSDFDISGCSFSNAGQSAINVSAAGTGFGTFNIHNNNGIQVRQGMGINLAATSTPGAAILRGFISNNTISTNVTNNAGMGINAVADVNGRIVADINNNTIVDNGTSSFDYGIRGGARGGTSAADLIINNNVAFGESAGVWFFAGNGAGGETSRTTVNFVSNNIDGGPTSFDDYFVEMYTGTTFQIQGFAGVGTNAAQVAAFIAATDDNAGAVVDTGLGTTVNYSNGTPAIAKYFTPANDEWAIGYAMTFAPTKYNQRIN